MLKFYFQIHKIKSKSDLKHYKTFKTEREKRNIGYNVQLPKIQQNSSNSQLFLDQVMDYKTPKMRSSKYKAVK